MCQPALANPGTGQCREGANPALASAGVKFPALASEKSSQLHCWPVQGKRRTRSFLLTQSGQCRARSVCNCSARGIASRGQRLACALASCDARARAMWSARARCVGGTDLPGVLGVLVAALIMSVLPTGNAAPVTPCGAALAAPHCGATAILPARNDVSMCLVVLNTSAVQEQASTAARAGRCGSQYVRSFSELDTVLETVLAQQTKLDAQAAVVACLTGCIATGSCT